MLIEMNLVRLKCRGKKFTAPGDQNAAVTCCTHCGGRNFEFEFSNPIKNLIVV